MSDDLVGTFAYRTFADFPAMVPLTRLGRATVQPVLEWGDAPETYFLDALDCAALPSWVVRVGSEIIPPTALDPSAFANAVRAPLGKLRPSGKVKGRRQALQLGWSWTIEPSERDAAVRAVNARLPADEQIDPARLAEEHAGQEDGAQVVDRHYSWVYDRLDDVNAFLFAVVAHLSLFPDENCSFQDCRYLCNLFPDNRFSRRFFTPWVRRAEHHARSEAALANSQRAVSDGDLATARGALYDALDHANRVASHSLWATAYQWSAELHATMGSDPRRAEADRGWADYCAVRLSGGSR